VKKRRGELSPEQQQVVREIALEVETRHETAAAEAEAFLRAKRDVEAANLAAGQSLLEADLEAKRELAAALQAEAEAAGLERAKEDALAEAAEQEGRIYSIATEGQELESAANQLRAKREDLLKAKDALTSQVERAKGKKRRANMKRALTRSQKQLAANEAQLAAVESQIEDAKHEFESAASIHSDEKKRAQSIERRQGDAQVDRLLSEAAAAAGADELASFVPRASPVRRPQTRSQTRRQQKTAELSRAVTRSMSRAESAEAPAQFVLSPAFEDLLEHAAAFETPSSRSRRPRESKIDSPPVQALGRPVDVIKGVADRLGISYPKNMGRPGIYARILDKDRDEAEAVRHLLYA
jgi:myosin heavy subunit